MLSPVTKMGDRSIFFRPREDDDGEIALLQLLTRFLKMLNQVTKDRHNKFYAFLMPILVADYA